jgi:hypothetical protein
VTKIEKLTRERDNWMETAMQESRNREYYRGLVVQIGQMFGESAKTCDDGSKAEDVLCAKVPQLVHELFNLHEIHLQELAALRKRLK